ncbi:hypothetical protein RRG08_063910 [Elysia crispata]|uniref:Uncharacterized protein n=1 Tax=Elysia crispata TaxID=231223 RepID=A0AAE0YEA9_9GAST|nr:hypothetical protein RRG08_063910 [Elysia crispata]
MWTECYLTPASGGSKLTNLKRIDSQQGMSSLSPCSTHTQPESEERRCGMAWIKDKHFFLCGLIFMLGVCLSHAQDGYLLTVPRVLRHGTSFQYCLTMYGDVASEKQAALNFIDSETGKIIATDDHLYTTGQQSCRDFSVPPPGEYRLLVTNSTAILHDAVKVTVLDSKIITLVQTDKPMYKPGQKVKFRVMTLLSDMKARTGQIKSIYVNDPNNFRVKQYLNVDTQGIATLDFQLGSEAKLGVWTIEVNVDESDAEKGDEESLGQFTVMEYVLPRFEVEIEPPPFILASDETISGKVCGKYTYGKPVTGFLHLDVCWTSQFAPEGGPCHSQVIELEGCYNFTVKTSDIRHVSYYTSQLEIRAKITEAGTGNVVSKNHTGPEQTMTPLDIQIDDYTNSFFKPGLPYYGRVTVTQPDGRPAAGEVIRVTAQDYDKSLRYIRNFTTNDAGQLVFALCEGFTANTTNIYISAVSMKFEEKVEPGPVFGPPQASRTMYQPMASRQVRQWFSPSLSYVQLPRPEFPHTCGQRLTLNVPYTTRKDTHTAFQYQVMARGRVVKTGQMSHEEGVFLYHWYSGMLISGDGTGSGSEDRSDESREGSLLVSLV